MSPAGLGIYTSQGRWKLARHLALLNRKLLDVVAGRCRHLAVELPVRHGKSEFISTIFPAWILGNFPDWPVMLASYEADFAAHWGGKARDLLEAYGPSLFNVRVRSDKRAANWWAIEGHTGYMVSAGIGGPVSGKGARIAIIDDPIKNEAEAQSKLIRDKHWGWYQSVLYPRLEPDGAVVIGMARWHEDDLLGRAIREGAANGEPWEIIRLPAIAETGEIDMLGRQPGEALWPERYSAARLEKIRKTVGPSWWSALYQQRPQPAGGAYFTRDWFRYYVEVETGVFRLHDGEIVKLADLRLFATEDLASSTKTTADYTVITVFGATPVSRRLLVLDQFRERIEAPKKIPTLWTYYRKWGFSFAGIETVGYQLSEVQRARAEGLPVRELAAKGDKVARALTAAALMQGEAIQFPRSASWLAELESELIAFPTGAHDDQVDTLAYGAIAMTTIVFGGLTVREWPAEIFHGDLWFRDWPAREKLVVRVVACDPSKDEKSEPDDFVAIVDLGRGADGLLYVQAYMGRWPAPDIVRNLVALGIASHAEIIALEAKVLDGLFGAPLVDECKRVGAKLPIGRLDNADDEKLDVRIRRLGEHLLARRFRFHDDPFTRLLVEQVQEFPSGEHVDGPHALELALRAAVLTYNARVAPADEGFGGRMQFG